MIMSIKIIYSAHIDEPVNLPEIRRQTQHWKQSDLWCQSVTTLECELSDGSPKLVLLLGHFFTHGWFRLFFKSLNFFTNAHMFLANCPNGHAYATVLCPSVAICRGL